MYKLSVAAVLLGGAGLASAAPAKKATLALGTATVSGEVDAKTLEPVVKRSASKLLACYTAALAKVPDLHGTATATFTIGSQGNVTAAVAIGLSDEVEVCIAATIAKLKFAKPKRGKPIEVSYPLTYEPGDRGALAWFSTIQDPPNRLDDPEIPTGVGGSDGNYGFGRKGPAPGRGGFGLGAGGADDSTASIGKLKVTGALDEAVIRPHLNDDLQKLRGCYDKALVQNPRLQGTSTARFTIGPKGRVASATANGLHDKTVEACIVVTLQSIEFPRPKQGEVVVSCPLTFHPPSAAAPAKK